MPLGTSTRLLITVNIMWIRPVVFIQITLRHNGWHAKLVSNTGMALQATCSYCTVMSTCACVTMEMLSVLLLMQFADSILYKYCVNITNDN